jgi:LysM repeat protein
MNKFVLSLFLVATTFGGIAQSVTQAYIDKWQAVAVSEMIEFGIPASITLAQGILESGNGQSELAKKSNNHFGIKCHLDWEGEKVYHDDDEDGECFRAYKKAEESFRDHSLFLKDRSRYAFLFEESPTDYKAWAKGLKKAGYATNKQYANRLIELIERYDLHQYDVMTDIPEMPGAPEILEPSLMAISLETSNKVDYFVAREGDSYESIAADFDKRAKDLLKYNELRYDSPLKVGDVVYLQPKKRRAAKENRYYTFRKDDDIYAVSQKFAVRLDKIYQRNNIPIGQQPAAGTRLILR